MTEKSPPLKVLIWVESLRGSGHMRVVSEMQRKLQERGMEVHVASSSRKFATHFDFAGVHWHETPGFTIDPATGFHRVCPSGLLFKDDPEYQQQRREFLCATADAVKPDILLTENWPLGRADFDSELEALVTHTRSTLPKSKIYSLSREILFGGLSRLSTDEQTKATTIIKNAMDGIVVFGPRGCPGLEESYPQAAQFADKTFYAGYLTPSVPPRNKRLDDATREVVLSVGGGVTYHGYQLFQTAINAHALTVNASRDLRVFVPPGYRSQMAEDGISWYDHLQQQAEELNRQHHGRIVVQETSADYLQHLADASMTISQGGSNTTFEVASAEAVDAVIAPIKQNENDIGQEVRAKIFSALGLVNVVPHQLIAPDDAQAVQEFAKLINSATGSKRRAQEQQSHHCAQTNLSFFGGENASAFIESAARNELLDKRHTTADLASDRWFRVQVNEHASADKPHARVEVHSIQRAMSSDSVSLAL